MIDCYGHWRKEQDYSKYPKEKWCDMDYVANYLDAIDYEPKNIGWKELIDRLIDNYNDDVMENGNDSGYEYGYYVMENPIEDDPMIYIPDFAAWLFVNGGAEEFDYIA